MYGEGGGGRGRLYTYRHTVTTRMTFALRWAAMRAILMFHNIIVRDKVTRQCPQTTIFEEKGELKRIQTEVPLLTSLKPAHKFNCIFWQASFLTDTATSASGGSSTVRHLWTHLDGDGYLTKDCTHVQRSLACPVKHYNLGVSTG